MLTMEEAIALVAPRLAAIEAAEGLKVVVTGSERRDDHWLIHYNTQDFVETGNKLDGLLDNYPLVVRDDGSVESSTTIE